MAVDAERIVIMSPTHPAEPRVPVTAKLSKRFYDVLGEDIANELVDWFNAVDLAYRTDLRELNELNYARFDSKLEQRLAELRAEFRTDLHQLRTEIQQVRTEIQQVRTELHDRDPARPRRAAALDVRFLGLHPHRHRGTGPRVTLTPRVDSLCHPERSEGGMTRCMPPSLRSG